LQKKMQSHLLELISFAIILLRLLLLLRSFWILNVLFWYWQQTVSWHLLLSFSVASNWCFSCLWLAFQCWVLLLTGVLIIMFQVGPFWGIGISAQGRELESLDAAKCKDTNQSFLRLFKSPQYLFYMQV
jgi:hypothetical protein